ncbi:MAG: hypothetical protein LUC88_10460 [Prevotella sp.]|nr:hypothetical protein [Prevotella sp.]
MGIDPEKRCKWHFDKKGNAIDDGPNKAMGESFKKTPYRSLIRESIQNSLDAVLDENKPVKVKFSVKAFDLHNYPGFFGLRQHIEGCMDYYKGNKDVERIYQPMIDYLDNLKKNNIVKIPYVEVSDYNTIGMEYEYGKTNNPFYAFVRAAGVSSKGDTGAGGSYGFGKAAYINMSKINTILVSTKTKDGNSYFEGVSYLCIHYLKGEEGKFESGGFYDNNGGKPIDKEENIPKRFQRKEIGTDIYIVGIDDSDPSSIYKDMKEAVLCNFWLAIYRNNLEVEFDIKNITSEDSIINKDNIISEMEKCFAYYTDGEYNPMPFLDAVIKAKCDETYFYKENEFLNIGKVKFYAIRDKNAKAKILYMRKPLMLVKSKRMQSLNGFYGVFVCDNLKGNEILRNTENSAHTEWDAANCKENGKIARKALLEIDEFIKDCIKLMFPDTDKNIQSITDLENYLYIPADVEDDDDNNEFLIDKKTDDGNAYTAFISNISVPKSNEKMAVGKVMISNPSSSTLIKDKTGKLLSGHGIRPKKTLGGGGVTSYNIDSRYKESSEGVQGKFLEEIPVTYRSFAQVEFGQVIHNIVIHSDYETANGRIDLLVGGEQSDDLVKIKNCFPQAVIHNNSISGLHIKKGKNMIKVVFADKMKHAIKLDAYELK